MKSTITYEFTGCFHGCPHISTFQDCDCLPMSISCWHDSFDNNTTGYPRIRGASLSSCILKEGQLYPDWCPVAKELK